MYKGEDLKLGDWVLVPFQAHGEAEKILPAVVIEIVDKPEASFSFKIKEVLPPSRLVRPPLRKRKNGSPPTSLPRPHAGPNS